jgi:hypothetical protein
MKILLHQKGSNAEISLVYHQSRAIWFIPDPCILPLVTVYPLTYLMEKHFWTKSAVVYTLYIVRNDSYIGTLNIEQHLKYWKTVH